MTSGQFSKPAGWFTGRTRLITIASIVAVGLAGATAVSANIGILDSASDSPVGNASAAGDLATPPTQVVDVYLPDTTTSTAPASTLPSADPAVQQFTVDVAGTVAVAATETGLRLEQVAPAAGWSWTLSQSDPSALMVTMTNGARTFEFTATRTADGSIAASVDEPIVTPAPTGTAGGDDDVAHFEDEDEHADEDEHEAEDEYEHEDEHEEYEGGEDDD
jgi:hypothetical protein